MQVIEQKHFWCRLLDFEQFAVVWYKKFGFVNLGLHSAFYLKEDFIKILQKISRRNSTLKYLQSNQKNQRKPRSSINSSRSLAHNFPVARLFNLETIDAHSSSLIIILMHEIDGNGDTETQQSTKWFIADEHWHEFVFSVISLFCWCSFYLFLFIWRTKLCGWFNN